ncbi:MAG TPA: glycosyltransferase family 25 protein [Rhizobium sp.]|nr:glycosyltransferase family 25 protein [Rhizobium sp.]
MTPPPGLGVWLINLARSTARRETMEARLAAIGLDYTLFPAVDGTAEWDRLQSTILADEFRRNVGREIMKGEIGAYHSHLGVWQALLDSPHTVGLVLEDDVVFHDDFMAALQLALDHADQWDFLKLNKIRAKNPRRQARLGPYSLNAYAGPATGLGSYLIRRDLAARLLPAMLPIRRPIDHELDRIHVHDFRHYGLEPFPSHVDDGNESTITGSNFGGVQKWPLWRRLPTLWARAGTRLGRLSYLSRMGRLGDKA